MRRRRRKASVKSPSDSVDKLELKEGEGIKDGSGKKKEEEGENSKATEKRIKQRPEITRGSI